MPPSDGSAVLAGGLGLAIGSGVEQIVEGLKDGFVLVGCE
jgi:hypothetical protein